MCDIIIGTSVYIRNGYGVNSFDYKDRTKRELKW